MSSPIRYDETAELAGLGSREKVYRCHRPLRYEGLALLLTMLVVDGVMYELTKSRFLSGSAALLVLVASFRVLRRIPPTKGLSQVIVYGGGLLLVHADGPPVPVPWETIESSEVGQGAVGSKGTIKTGARRRFPIIAVYLKKKRWPLVLVNVVGRDVLAKVIEEALRPGLLDRLRGTLDTEGRVDLESLAVTDTGLVLPGLVGDTEDIALEWTELDETRTDGLAKIVVRPRHAKERRIQVPNATVVRDFIEETRSLSA
ncbi:hypothetical protein [Streptomyces sp. NPDC051665]|uniref:hypothetical protein n=1 Tax=Streptomyces sp. NPDC051665 TaxID=3154647 RepID=UPI00341B50D2